MKKYKVAVVKYTFKKTKIGHYENNEERQYYYEDKDTYVVVDHKNRKIHEGVFFEIKDAEDFIGIWSQNRQQITKTYCNLKSDSAALARRVRRLGNKAATFWKKAATERRKVLQTGGTIPEGLEDLRDLKILRNIDELEELLNRLEREI